MAHEISFDQRGRAEIASALVAPWHGLGVVLSERMTVHQAINEAHTNWNVNTGALYYKDKEGKLCEVPDKKYTYRDDSHLYFGVVGNNYTPIQQPEQAEFLEALAGEGGIVEVHGALYGGKKVFWTIRVPDDIIITPKDRVNQYLILANGHDGSLSFKVFWSPIRVVCKNTLMMALGGKTKLDGISLRHTKNVMDRVKEAQRILGLSTEFYKELGAVAKEMVAQKISDDQFDEEFLKPLIPIPEDGKTHTKLENVRSQIRLNYEKGIGSVIAGRTTWGAFNATTMFVSHQMGGGRNSKVDGASKRFDSILLGGGRDLSLNAFALAKKLTPALN